MFRSFFPNLCYRNSVRRLQTRPSPVPGFPVLTPETWTPEKTNLPVECIFDGKNILALLQRPQGRRFWWLLTPQGKEVRVNKFNIVFQWPVLVEGIDTPEFTLKQLVVLEGKVEGLMQKIIGSVIVEDIWHHFLKTPPEKSISGYDVATYLVTLIPDLILEPELVYACHRLLGSWDIYFQKNSIHGYLVRNKKEIDRHKKLVMQEKEEEEARLEFIKKIKQRLDAMQQRKQIESHKSEKDSDPVSQLDQGTIFNPKYDTQFLDQIKNYALHSNGDIAKEDVVKLFLEPLGFGRRPHDAFNLLVGLDIYQKYDNPHVLRWRHELLPHNAQAEKEARKIKKTPPPDPMERFRKRVESPVFSLTESEENFKSFGFSLETKEEEEDGIEWIYLHISDIARFIPMDSVLDKIARKRVTTIFLPEATYPMIPENILRISEFNSGQETPAVTLGVALNQSGKLEQYRVFPSIVSNVLTTTYGGMDALLLGTMDTDLPDSARTIKEQHYHTWVKLEDIAERRRKYRLKREARPLWLPRPLVSVETDKEGHAHVHIGMETNPMVNARGVVHEMEVLAGEVAADFMERSIVPAAFQGQDKVPLDLEFEPSNDPLEDRIKQESLDKFYQRDRNPNTIIKIRQKLRNTPPVLTSIIKSPHSGLGLPAYLPITSPLHHYLHLVNLHQLKAELLCLWLPYEPDEVGDAVLSPENCFSTLSLTELIPRLELHKQEIGILTSNSTRFWILHNILQEVRHNKDLYFKSLVITSRDDRNETLVLIRKFELEANMIIPRRVEKGSTIFVKVEHVDPFYDRLILTEVPNIRTGKSENIIYATRVNPLPKTTNDDKRTTPNSKRKKQK